MSALTITPNIEKKSAVIVGRIAGGEHVSVRLKNCAALDSETLRLRILFFKKPLRVSQCLSKKERRRSGSRLMAMI